MPADTEEELTKHFTTFQSYDLDNSGFISPENLGEIMTALEIPFGAGSLKSMIDEVAILSCAAATRPDATSIRSLRPLRARAVRIPSSPVP